MLPLFLLLGCTSAHVEDSGETAFVPDSGDSGASSSTDPWETLDGDVPDGGDVPVSGYALAFSASGGVVAGATVTVVEHPELQATTGDDGRFDLGPLPRGELVNFELSHPDFVAIRTGTFLLGHPLDGGDAITDLSFQVPDPTTYGLMAQATGVDPDDGFCQVSTTVTRRGHDMVTGSGTHGEPGATASLEPAAAWEAGPIYFDLAAVNIIWPSPALTETSHDGGVVWTNVPPGDYVMRGAKDGAEIRPVRIRCTPGYLVNAAPPWGLQVLSGGLDPEDPGYEG
ncbi:MAG: hypothetical protein H6742_14560 [Alphaproteobacteria bacterium]|nr:hypothetical protein [Alphaproteobacteria bacterium]